MISPTYGELSMGEIVNLISQIASEPGEVYNVMVGTDSQNFDRTKVVVVIAFHHVGHGGIFFYEVTHIRRINNLGQKLLYETQLSLECARKLVDAFEDLKDNTGFDYEACLNLGIHVDAGQNGPSKKVIPEIVVWITACGYKVVVKPESYAASSIANKYSK